MCPALPSASLMATSWSTARASAYAARMAASRSISKTIFQIGSNTKAFLATAIAIMVDRGKLKWDDRIVDLYPDFQMKDPWVTREFRLFDLLRPALGASGPRLTTCFAMLGFDESALIRSLRYCRSDNKLPDDLRLHEHHAPAGQASIVANAAGAAGLRHEVLQTELLDPLGMKNYDMDGRRLLEGAANHAERPPLDAGRQRSRCPFTPIFPYRFRRGRQHQLQHRGHGAVGPVATRQRLVRRTAASSRPRISPSPARPRSQAAEKAFYAYGWMEERRTRNGSCHFSHRIDARLRNPCRFTA